MGQGDPISPLLDFFVMHPREGEKGWGGGSQSISVQAVKSGLGDHSGALEVLAEAGHFRTIDDGAPLAPSRTFGEVELDGIGPGVDHRETFTSLSTLMSISASRTLTLSPAPESK